MANDHNEDLLTITLPSQFWEHDEIPEPAEGGSWVDDSKAHEVITVIVRSEVKLHFTYEP